MQQSQKLVEHIQDRIQSRFESFRRVLLDAGPDFAPVIDEAERFLRGGKRFRARFLVLGYRSIRELNFNGSLTPEAEAVCDAACALEFFHAAALVHDDIIDNSDTRRGHPSAHKIFEAQHRRDDLRGDATRFGLATAILLGDLLQSWADELFQQALDDLSALSPNAQPQTARAVFNRMRSEVTMGQYLDVLEEHQPSFAEDQLQLERSTRVLVYKSAKYSVQAPLLIGAALAGAESSQETGLSNFGLPVGVAFQLRDDILGIFGDEKLTGKPTGDDLREGKRTILVTLARRELPSGPRRVFDDLHGNEDLTSEQISMLQTTISDTGALRQVERMISQNVGIARETINEARLLPAATRELIALAELAADRSF